MADNVQAVDRNTASELFQLPLRINGVWPLAGIGSAPAPEGLRRALEWRRPAELDWLQPTDEDDRHPDEDGDVEIDENDEVWDEFGGECIARGLLGVVVEAHMPVMRGHASGSISYSWWHYRIKVFYAPTLTEGIAAAMKAADEAWEKAWAEGKANG